MLQIGEFAAVTGLSVKALRHYDKERALSPEMVDEATGYRYYSPQQVRSGVLLRTLRAAGVPLGSAARAVETGDAGETLSRHREALARKRLSEDDALSLAESVVQELSAPPEIVERRMPEQPFVGKLLPMPASNEEMESFDGSARESTLIPRLIRDGLGPVGNSWTMARAKDVESTSFLLCWPTSRPVPSGWTERGETAGTLPARTDLVAIRRVAAEGSSGSAQPLLAALFDALAARGADVRGMEIRQSVSQYSAGGHTLEIAAQLRLSQAEHVSP